VRNPSRRRGTNLHLRTKVTSDNYFSWKSAVCTRKAIKKAAKERQAHGGPRSGKLPERSKGDTRDKVAKYTGVSGRTMEKAEVKKFTLQSDLTESHLREIAAL